MDMHVHIFWKVVKMLFNFTEVKILSIDIQMMSQHWEIRNLLKNIL